MAARTQIIAVKRMRCGDRYLEPGEVFPQDRWEWMGWRSQKTYLDGGYVREQVIDDGVQPAHKPHTEAKPEGEKPKVARTHDENCKCIGCNNRRKRAEANPAA